jgi:hypothetical protein
MDEDVDAFGQDLRDFLPIEGDQSEARCGRDTKAWMAGPTVSSDSIFTTVDCSATSD